MEEIIEEYGGAMIAVVIGMVFIGVLLFTYLELSGISIGSLVNRLMK